MTVDECIDRLTDLVLQELKPLTPDYSFHDAVAARDRFTVVLHALILTESVRAAAILREVADKCKTAKLLDESSLLNTYADEIVATSPGKTEPR